MQSILWTTNGTGDGASPYTQAQVSEWLRKTFLADPATQGILPGVGGEFAVSGTSSPLTVASGFAYVYGFPAWDNSAATVAVPTPVIGTTGHRIVLRADWAAQTVRVVLLSSSDGVATPPAVTQTAGTRWEISLATLTITTGGTITVTDTRQYAHANLMLNGSRLDDNSVGSAKLIDGPGSGVDADTVDGYQASQLWRADNDGAGSGLDADLLDGLQASQFWRPDNDGDGSGLDADKVAGVDYAPFVRIGGVAANWWSSGSTVFYPSAVRMIAGATYITIPSGSAQATEVITLPFSFSGQAMGIGNPGGHPSDGPATAVVSGSANNQISVTLRRSGSTVGSFGTTVQWIAIGPA